MIRLMCIEDHSLIVEGLQRRLRPLRDDIRIAYAFTGIGQAIREADPAEFDIILLDLWLPGNNPVVNHEKLVKAFPVKPVIMLTMEDSVIWKKRMYEAGVKGYLSKSCDKKELLETIHKVYQGETVYPSGSSPGEIYPGTAPSDMVETYQLKPSEREIVKLMAEGMRIKEIAGKVQVSPASVEKVLRILRNQFKTKTNNELMCLLSSLREI